MPRVPSSSLGWPTYATCLGGSASCDATVNKRTRATFRVFRFDSDGRSPCPNRGTLDTALLVRAGNLIQGSKHPSASSRMVYEARGSGLDEVRVLCSRWRAGDLLQTAGAWLALLRDVPSPQPGASQPKRNGTPDSAHSPSTNLIEENLPIVVRPIAVERIVPVR